MISKLRLLSGLLLGCSLAANAFAEQSALKAVMKWEDADFLSSACFLLEEWRPDSDESIARQVRAQLERLKTAVATGGVKDLQALVPVTRRGEEADRQILAYHEQLSRYKFGTLRHIFSYGPTVYAFVTLQPIAAEKPLVASLAFAREAESVTGFEPAPPSDTAQALLFRWYYSKFGPGKDSSTGSRCNTADLARLTYRIPVTGTETAGLLVRGSSQLDDMPSSLLQRWFKPGLETAMRALAQTDVSAESWRRLQEYRAAPSGKEFEKQLVGERPLFWLDLGPLRVVYTHLENGTVRPAHFFADGSHWRLGHIGLSNMTTRIFDRRELAEAALQSPPFAALRRSR